MVEFVAKRPSSPRHLPPFLPHPSSLGLAGLVELLTVVPLEANPHLCKVISLPMPLEEIVNGRGEIFEISDFAT